MPKKPMLRTSMIRTMGLERIRTHTMDFLFLLATANGVGLHRVSYP